MKTVEEKAKAYDEVLNKLRHFITKGVDPLITRADVQDFFPELAESEGEKIKKRITLCLEECVHSDVIRDYEKDECIAWLEKQEGCEHIKKDWLEHIKQSWYKEGFIDGKYSGGTSKEWTINDATTLSELIDFLENGTAKLQHDLTRYANWLKIQFTPIEKQGEQNPAEWSEEDEQRLNTCLYILQPKTFVGNTETTNTKWLKSLKDRVRPHWKPSDEQMKLLSEVQSALLGKDCHNRFTCFMWELKKLKDK